MKAYIGNVDWADEGDVFFFSVESEENLKAMKNLIETLVKLDLFFPIEIYWGGGQMKVLILLLKISSTLLTQPRMFQKKS